MLKHPNIVSISFADTDRRGLYMAMEYVEGMNWAELPKRDGPLSIEEATRLLYDAAGALHYAHTHPSAIIHRDIKPQNLMLTTAGQVRVLDLGLAKALTDNDDSHSYRTQTGTLLGTPSYMAPEQFEGTQNLDARVDIYSLGLTFFICLPARLPLILLRR